jgi:hypothetical protein
MLAISGPPWRSCDPGQGNPTRASTQLDYCTTVSAGDGSASPTTERSTSRYGHHALLAPRLAGLEASIMQVKTCRDKDDAERAARLPTSYGSIETRTLKDSLPPGKTAMMFELSPVTHDHGGPPFDASNDSTTRAQKQQMRKASSAGAGPLQYQKPVPQRHPPLHRQPP